MYVGGNNMWEFGDMGKGELRNYGGMGEGSPRDLPNVVIPNVQQNPSFGMAPNSRKGIYHMYLYNIYR